MRLTLKAVITVVKWRDNEGGRGSVRGALARRCAVNGDACDGMDAEAHDAAVAISFDAKKMELRAIHLARGVHSASATEQPAAASSGSTQDGRG